MATADAPSGVCSLVGGQGESAVFNPWPIAEEAADLLCESLELLGDEVLYVPGTLPGSGPGPPLSVLMGGHAGAIAFIEDCNGAVWLSLWDGNQHGFSARKLNKSDRAHELAELCIQTLAGLHDRLRWFVAPH